MHKCLVSVWTRKQYPRINLWVCLKMQFYLRRNISQTLYSRLSLPNVNLKLSCKVVLYSFRTVSKSTVIGSIVFHVVSILFCRDHNTPSRGSLYVSETGSKISSKVTSNNKTTNGPMVQGHLSPSGQRGQIGLIYCGQEVI